MNLVANEKPQRFPSLFLFTYNQNFVNYTGLSTLLLYTHRYNLKCQFLPHLLISQLVLFVVRK